LPTRQASNFKAIKTACRRQPALLGSRHARLIRELR
jgi:hypothetical protein